MASTPIVFQKLSQATTLYQPLTEVAASPEDGPTTVLILGFMGGTTQNLARYSREYNMLYPAARIIVVTSTLTDTPGFKILRSAEDLKQRAEIPAKVLLASTKNEGDRLLVHAFSNGGGMTLAAICKAYRRLTGTVLPARIVVFDSLPGGDKFTKEFSRWVRAISVGLPASPFLQWPARVLIVIIVIVLMGLPSLFGLENAATQARRELNDENLINLNAKRLYIYSEADALIGANEVREYAAESAAKNWDVETVNFGSSGHVRHAIVDKGESKCFSNVTMPARRKTSTACF
jgi:hypothetical protein